MPVSVNVLIRKFTLDSTVTAKAGEFSLPGRQTPGYGPLSLPTGNNMNSDMHDDAGHLTLLGWSMFALYLAAALLSFRKATASRRESTVASPQYSSASRIWFWLGVVLTALGVNKPLNLQTRLIELGRHIADEQHWLPYRAELFALFFAGFMLVILALFAVVARRWRQSMGRFAHEFPLTATGCALVCAYIVIRAADIDHLDDMMRFDLERIPLLWLMEAGGLALISIESLHAVFKKPKS